MSHKSIIIILLYILFLPLTVFAQSDGIPLEKDVFLESFPNPQFAIQNPMDLPDQVTFNLYDARDALIPIATQTFPRGAYTVEFEFSKSDGLTLGTVARFKANFTQILNLIDIDANGEPLKPKELWTDLALDGTLTGTRKKVSDDTMVQLLLASDASIATYLTLVYEGDENPITTIYRDLPLSLKSSNSSSFPFNSYFSPVLGTYPSTTGPAPTDAGEGSDGQIQYSNSGVQAGASQFYYDDANHRVGIGTSAPSVELEIETSGATNDAELKLNATGYAGAYLHLDSGIGGGGFQRIDGRVNGTLHWRIAGPENVQNALAFYTGSSPTEQVRIDNNGKVGIGTTVPKLKLDARGTATAPSSSGNVNSGAVWVGSMGGATGSFGMSIGAYDAEPYYTWLQSHFNDNAGICRALALNPVGGNVGIGTTNPTYKLSVNGTIRAKEIIVDTGWSDFVFDDNYRLPPLSEVEQFISSNKHLPGIPTASEVKENGVILGNISSKLLQKIEELTLYVIELKKENDFLKAQTAAIQAQLDNRAR